MKHPSQETLALHAGGDLGWLAAWKTARHVAGCESCAAEIAAFSELRDTLPELGEIPEIPWNRMAADMRANIRLGLAAGECVREAVPAAADTLPLFRGARATLALASVLALMVTGIILERPRPKMSESAVVRAGEERITSERISSERITPERISSERITSERITSERISEARISDARIDPRVSEPMVQATAHGIQRRSGDQGFALMNMGAQSVTYTVSAKGSVGARYVDPETDQVTMTKVYVE